MTCDGRYLWQLGRFGVQAGCELPAGEHPTGSHAGRVDAQVGYELDLTGLVVRWPQEAE